MTDPSYTFVCVADGADTAATEASVEAQHGARLTIVPDLREAASVFAAAEGWVGFLDPGTRLTRDAIATLAAALDGRDDIELVYSDETVHTSAGPQPRCKPDWSPDRLRCQPYLGRVTLVRAASAAAVGGLRPDLGSCAELDLLLRVGEEAGAVAHVPVVLCESPAGPLPYPAFDADTIDTAIDVVDDHLRRTGVAAVARRHDAPGLLRLEPRLTTRPLVSIVIPTGGARRTVRGTETTLVVGCVRSILERSTYTEVEVIVVVDAATDPSTRAALTDLGARVRLVEFDEPFHFSRKVNQGVLAAAGEVVVLLNDDTEVQTPGWLEAMLVYALDPAVGAVGARLLFEDGRIQHAGVLGVGGNPGHAYHGFPADTAGYAGNALVPGDFLAVTGACLMTRRDTFFEVGGMSAWFPASYNDLDFCCKLQRAGYRVVATPDAVLDHYESSSRDGGVGDDELELIRRRWGRWLRADPYYSPSFTSGIADYDLSDSVGAT